MKLLVLILLIGSISACVTTAVKHIDTDNIPDARQITLVSECPKECQSLVGNRFSIDGASTLLFGKDNPVKNYVVLTSINGKKGENTYYDPYGSFNNTWDASFKLKTVSGRTVVSLLPSSRSNAPNEEVTLEFESSGQHQYLIGSMGWREIRGNTQINSWHPVIVDLTTSDIIYPKENVEWRKFCTRNQEWSGNVSCP